MNYSHSTFQRVMDDFKLHINSTVECSSFAFCNIDIFIFTILCIYSLNVSICCAYMKQVVNIFLAGLLVIWCRCSVLHPPIGYIITCTLLFVYNMTTTKETTHVQRLSHNKWKDNISWRIRKRMGNNFWYLHLV